MCVCGGAVLQSCDYSPLLQDLADNPDNHYGLNMVNQKITFPRDENFSDNELAFLPYFTYCQASQVCNRIGGNAGSLGYFK